MRRWAVLSFAIAIALAAVPSVSEACLALHGAGEIVPIAGEEALVVWDEANRTEHFVRRAAFRRAPADFGFLVPTPTQPTLSEASDAVFHRLFEIYRRPVTRSSHTSSSADRLRGVERDRVEVVEQVHVAGMEGTVLAASSATALSEWLASHGYQSSPAIAAWLAPYVAGSWFVTAFRVDPDGRPSMRTRSVCMSFRTDRPFFPYSEPAHEGPTRPFRVSVVAPHRMDATLGDAPWSVSAGYAGHSARLMTALRGAIPEGVTLDDPWITTFDERRSRRGTDDLFFVPAASDTPRASRIDAELMP
jgi:hypothetical protein